MEANDMTDTEETLTLTPTPGKKPPREMPARDIAQFRNAFATRCAKCPSMLAIPLPYVHCPNCCDRWKARGMKNPVRCRSCGFNLRDWRMKNGVPDLSNEMALVS